MNNDTFSFRWGVPVLDEGSTIIPNHFINVYSQVITRTEWLLIIHLAAYHYESARGECRPSLATIAEKMGYKDRRNVRQLVEALKEKGYLIVTARKDDQGIQLPNLYDFSPLSKIFQALSFPLGGDQLIRGGRIKRSEGVGSIDPREGDQLILQRIKDQEKKKEKNTTNTAFGGASPSYAKAGTKKVYLEEGDLQFTCVRCEIAIELGKLPKRDSKCHECGQPYEVYEADNPTPTWKPKKQKRAYPLHLVIPSLPEHLSDLDCRTKDISEGIATAWRLDPDMILEKLEWAFNLQALSGAFGKHQICERARTAFTTSFQEKGTYHEPAPQSRSNVPLPAGEQDLGTESQNEHPHTAAEEWDPTSPW